MNNSNKYLSYSSEVKHALENNLPIVALESTIISHGMPYPKNVEMANKCQEIIRNHGAVPATVAIMNGKIKIGLEPYDLEILAKTPGVVKVS
ncbi:MAG: pseudouridine-5'-phosphate glycosidase, partial [Tenericutes bacterium]|nr:pseudouridine-5'-phosphate glycosidase [Mycoplasmatota bacterium]